MDRRNILYYAAAAGTVLVFIIAVIGLATCGDSGTRGASTQEQAVINAYQQGYLEGYSKGYSDGFSTGMKSSVVGSATDTVSSRRGCPVVAPNRVFEDDSEVP